MEVSKQAKKNKLNIYQRAILEVQTIERKITRQMYKDAERFDRERNEHTSGL